MEKNKKEPRFIINVSAMEGKFYRLGKSSQHAHTNLAKASLNMITLTAGLHYSQRNIYISSVDTGWIIDENPILKRNKEFTIPLDEIDGAMRVLDSIYIGFNKNILYHSIFLKDYKKSKW